VKQRRWSLWAKFNPWKKLADGSFEEITDKNETKELFNATKKVDEIHAVGKGNYGLDAVSNTKTGHWNKGNLKEGIYMSAKELDKAAANHLGINGKEFNKLMGINVGDTYKGVTRIKAHIFEKGNIRVRLPQNKRGGKIQLNLEIKDNRKTWGEIDQINEATSSLSKSDYRTNAHIDLKQ
jgi:hypothetical protein